LPENTGTEIGRSWHKKDSREKPPSPFRRAGRERVRGATILKNPKGREKSRHGRDGFKERKV